MIWTVLDIASIMPDRHDLLTVCYLGNFINYGSKAAEPFTGSVAIWLRGNTAQISYLLLY
jgi:hypothetical protein